MVLCEIQAVSEKSYPSPFRLIQITDFLEFLCEYCEEIFETFTEF